MTYGPPPMPPPAKPKRTTRIVVIVIAAVVALCCVGGVVGGFFIYRSVQDATAPIRDATTAYTDAVRNRDYQGAYGRLCARIRAETSQQEFERRQTARAPITSYDIQGVKIQNINGAVTGEATVKMEQGGRSVREVLTLVKEDGQWKVCS